MSPRTLLGFALAVTFPLAGCTAAPEPAPVAAAPALRLVAFDSCEQLLTDLRKAASAAVGPWGLPGGADLGRGVAVGGAFTGIPAVKAEAAAPVPAAGASYSGTNINEASADEPDIVKTDGRRIVTVQGDTLRVFDAQSRRLVGRLALGAAGANLLLAGDRALVMAAAPMAGTQKRPYSLPTAAESQVLLVDVSGAPRLVSRYQGTGFVVDARQTGTVARVVLKSAPRITLPTFDGQPAEDKMVERNKSAIGKATVDAWLPRWKVTTGAVESSGTVGCDRVSRPPTYSGSSMVTVLTFDLAAPALTDGDPVSVAADADTVYGTGSSLYLASDQRWRLNIWPGRAAEPVADRTELYRFDLSKPGRPVFAASGSVPGFLVNQYALSEWDGHLRVATTSQSAASSAIRTLALGGNTLQEVGSVTGLGKNERIYAVRYLGPKAYVVTFKQTDPLYAVDLSDPAAPKVTGELKITGYSAHLQSVGDNRLVGIGQEASTSGRTQGLQVSLFDTTDPAAPRRLAQQMVKGGQSEAEWDPHAILWWPATGLLVLPLTQLDMTSAALHPKEIALALRVTPAGLQKIGELKQPAVGGYVPTIRRTLVIDNTLWTLSDQGLQASTLSTLDQQAWLPN